MARITLAEISGVPDEAIIETYFEKYLTGVGEHSVDNLLCDEEEWTRFRILLGVGYVNACNYDLKRQTMNLRKQGKLRVSATLPD